MTAGLGLLGNAKIPPPKNILVSYFYYRRKDLDKLAGTRIIADSGAYSAKKNTMSYQGGVEVTTNKLIAWIRIWQHRLQWAAALDVANNVRQTRANWQRMVDAGIPAVSTLHVGDGPEEMDWYAAQGIDFLALGGMAGSVTPPSAQFRWLVSMFKYARESHPQMRFHGWGVTKKEWLRLPFYSVDSSGWGSSYRYGRLMLRHPVTGEMVGVDLDGAGAYDKKVAQMLVENYGITPAEIAKAGPKNRLLLVKLSALSASVQEQQWRDLYRNNPITAPQWGRLPGWGLADGPHQHLSLGGCGAGLRDEKVFSDFHGPHIHLVDGHLQHIQIVADLARGAAI